MPEIPMGAPGGGRAGVSRTRLSASGLDERSSTRPCAAQVHMTLPANSGPWSV